MLRRSLAAYSGWTVRDFHPLPSSLAVTDEHLREFSSYHIVSEFVNRRGLAVHLSSPPVGLR